MLQQNYNEKCDLWSVGVVLYILLCGKVPFPGESNKEIIENVLKADYHFRHEPFRFVSNAAKDLISNLLVLDVEKRFSAEQAYNHSWIQSESEHNIMTISQELFTNMKMFVQASKFKKATLTYLASKLPEKYFDDLRQIFIAADLNGNGKIEASEFRKVFDNIGVSYTQQDIQDLMDTLDTNNNGCIDYTEFLAGCMKAKIYLKEERIRDAFEFFDRVFLNMIFV